MLGYISNLILLFVGKETFAADHIWDISVKEVLKVDGSENRM